MANDEASPVSAAFKATLPASSKWAGDIGWGAGGVPIS